MVVPALVRVAVFESDSASLVKSVLDKVIAAVIVAILFLLEFGFAANIRIYRFFFLTRYLETLPLSLFSLLALLFSASVSSDAVTGVSLEILFVGRNVLSPLE